MREPGIGSLYSLFLAFGDTGRGGEIRTPDPLLPKQMRYQAALRPDMLTPLYRESDSECFAKR